MSDVPEPAPYGGLMVQGLDAENEQKQKLAEQAVEISVNGQSETLRPEAVYIKGVDSLSTKNIEAFVNYYLNYTFKEETSEDGDTKVVYEPLGFEEQVKFRVQWINDTAVNVAFETHEAAIKGLAAISITSSNPAFGEGDNIQNEGVSELVQERETKPYTPVIEFQKRLDLSHRLGIEPKKEEIESSGMDEDESAVVLHARMSLQSDRKVKNASAYSRYYLLHGEPERKPRHRQYKPKGPRRSRDRDYGEDLFASKIRGRQDDIEDDLFADKLKAKRNKSRSPSRNRDRDRSPSRMEE